MNADLIFFDFSNLEVSEVSKVKSILDNSFFHSIVAPEIRNGNIEKNHFPKKIETNCNITNNYYEIDNVRNLGSHVMTKTNGPYDNSGVHYKEDSKSNDYISNDHRSEFVKDHNGQLTSNDYRNTLTDNNGVKLDTGNISGSCNGFATFNPLKTIKNNNNNNIVIDDNYSMCNNNDNNNNNNIIINNTNNFIRTVHNKDIATNDININNDNNTIISNNSTNNTSDTIKVKSVKSWASLLKDKNDKQQQQQSVVNGTSNIVVNGNKYNGHDNDVIDDFVANTTTTTTTAINNNAKCMNESFNVDDKSVELFKKLVKCHLISTKCNPVVPRGFTNKSNRCYANSTLQALLVCSPFCHFLTCLNGIDIQVMEHLKLPILKSILEVYRKFEPASNISTTTIKETPTQLQQQQQQHAKRKQKHQQKQQQQHQQPHQQQQQQIKIGSPLDTNIIGNISEGANHKAFELNQQEDAEEFFSFILNKLHEEIIRLFKINEKNKTSKNNDDDIDDGGVDDDSKGSHSEHVWQQARSKNKFVNCVNPSDMEHTPLSDIFRGQIAHVLECSGQKDSVSLQPFITLQLDVQHNSVTSTNEALKKFVSREAVSNYTNSSNIAVEATKHTLFDSLPRVMVLHFKWFKYDAHGGLLKNTKQFLLDEQLEIVQDFLTSQSYRRLAPSMRKYHLFAVVNHVGSHADGGHYYTDAYHDGYQQWLRYDDEKVYKVKVSQVIHFNHPRVPYLAFYKQLHN